MIDALPTRVWEVLDAAFEEDEDGRVLIRQEDDCLVIRVPAPGRNLEWEDEVDEYTGTCTFALLPEANDRTRLHLRERHQATESDSRLAPLGRRVCRVLLDHVDAA